MNSLSQSRYTTTNQPNSQKSSKIKGIIFIQKPQHSPNESDQLIQLKSDKKIILHSYKKFKSFTYTFDYIYRQSEEQGFYDNVFREFNAADAIEEGYDYMLFCTGISTKNRKQIPGIEMIFYQQLVAIQENLGKNMEGNMRVNVIAIGEDIIVDLITGRSVQVRENQQKKIDSSQLIFVDAIKSQPETPYQILELIKSTLSTRKKTIPQSYYLMFIQICHKQRKQKILLINTTKDMEGYQKAWDNKNVLVLNKCVLGLLNKMESSKEIYIPFRDSKLTRIIKPFLAFGCKIDTIGYINPVDQQSSYHTLNLIKNISEIRFYQHSTSRLGTSDQNPEVRNIQTLINNKSKKLAQIRKNKTEQIQLLTHAKTDLLQKVRQNFKQEIKIQKKLHQVRGKLKIVKRSKQLNGLNIKNQELELSRSLEDNQIQYQLKKQKQLLEQNQRIDKERMQTIQNSTSITEKLKLLKEYYILAKNNQKQQSNQFLKNQVMINKFYQDKISFIDKQLKKSPMELLKPISHSVSIKKQLKSQKPEKSQKLEKIVLPGIGQVKKRLSLIKEKVKKGRVQYQSFLSRNVSQYQSYSNQPND